MSETCLLKISRILRTQGEGLDSPRLMRVLEETLKKEGQQKSASDKDRDAAADHIFSSGIEMFRSIQRRLVPRGAELMPEEKSPYKGGAEYLFDYATETNSESDEYVEAFGAAIMCAREWVEAENAATRFPNSWTSLLKAQQAIANFFGLEASGDKLLPETIFLLRVANKALTLDISKREKVVMFLKACKDTYEKATYNAARPGEYRVIGILLDDDEIIRGNFTSLEDARKNAVQPRSDQEAFYTRLRLIYDDEGNCIETLEPRSE
ncbi:MAG: hypothetical protein WC238_03255 [Parcubacteria group bacterium]